MKIDTVLRLLDAGYTRDEIKAFEEDNFVDILKDKEVEEPAKPVEEKEEPASEPETVDPYAGRLESIESTLKAIQAQNVRWSSMPESAAKPKTELEIVQEILGGIKSNGNE